MNIPANLKYTKDHEWLKIEGDEAYIGITEFAQSELGEIVFVEVDTVGDDLAANEVFGTIEAVKTTSDMYMPVSGTVLEFNPEIDEDEGDNPGIINSDPYGDAWIVKIKLSDMTELSELLDAAAYEALIS